MKNRFTTTNALCSDCREGYHCLGSTSGCACRASCENTNKVPDDAVYYPGGLTPMAPSKLHPKAKKAYTMPKDETVAGLRQQLRYVIDERDRLLKENKSLIGNHTCGETEHHGAPSDEGCQGN